MGEQTSTFKTRDSGENMQQRESITNLKFNVFQATNVPVTLVGVATTVTLTTTNVSPTLA